MNILASYNWIKEHVKTKLTPEAFAARISLSGPGIERWHSMAEALDGVVVGEILTIEKHPNADKLHVATVEIGRAKPIHLIFGSMVTMQVGFKVPVAVAPTVLPGGKKIEQANMRGVISEGMLCLDQEMGLIKDGVSIHFFDRSMPNGTPITKALDLNDTVFDIEVTTNRPDAFSIVGLAREAAAILGAPFVSLTSTPPKITAIAKIPISIGVDSPKACTRYQAAVVTDVRVGPSPWWLQRRLISAGIRPISNMVDIANYVMLELGQPMHAFDYDRLMKKTEVKNGKTVSSAHIVARAATKGETIKALDGKTYNLTPSMLVIADAKRPIAIAGVMGGEETSVTRETTTVVFESATFDPVSVRHTARDLNLHSDSSLRFEKGLSTESTSAALVRAIELAIQIASGKLASPLLDRRAGPYKKRSFSWNPEATRTLIGVPISTVKMKQVLTTLGFSIAGGPKMFRVTVPSWRDHDIESSVDFTEEIARVYGYHTLPSVLPSGPQFVREPDSLLVAEDMVRDLLVGAGCTEIYGYSFSDPAFVKSIAGDIPMLALKNPLTADLGVMRPSLLPTMLAAVAANINERSEGALFEVSNRYEPHVGELPKEIPMIAFALWGAGDGTALWSRARGIFEHLCLRFRIPYELNHGGTALFHPGRVATIRVQNTDVGVMGEVHPEVSEKLHIKCRVVVCTVHIVPLLKAKTQMAYESIPSFPPVRRDISFLTDRRNTYAAIEMLFMKAPALLVSTELFDHYEGKGVPENKKSLAYHLTFSDPKRTLTGEEVDRVFTEIVHLLEKGIDAEVRLNP